MPTDRKVIKNKLRGLTPKEYRKQVSKNIVIKKIQLS